MPKCPEFRRVLFRSPAGQKLMRLGYRALVVEGKPKDPEKRWLLFVNKDGAALRECPELKMLRTYAASEKLAESYSERAAFVICGPAGQVGLSGASVPFADEGQRPRCG